MDYVEIEGEKYFSPFTLFERTKTDADLLEKWQQHYVRLNIRTTLRPATRRNGQIYDELMVHYEDDQKVWPRKLY
jgi:hypothetical protein